jgi:hypothetical protein
MAFKMKGNPIKMGTIKGTAGHKSVLKQISNPDTQLGTYTKSQKSRAFGEDVDAREGAKILRTSTYNYHRMKKRWDKRQGNVETTEKKKTEKKKKKTKTKVSSKEIVITGHDAAWDYKRVENEDGSFTYFTKKKSEENFYPVKDDIGLAIEEKVSFDVEQGQEVITTPPPAEETEEEDGEEKVVEGEKSLIGGDFLEKSQEDQGLRFPELGKYDYRNAANYRGTDPNYPLP